MSKKKYGKHLQFYMDCMKAGTLPDYGLCISLGGDLLDLFTPTKDDERLLRNEELSILYWASGVSSHYKFDEEKYFCFTPLRQTIVLFMAAINGEL